MEKETVNRFLKEKVKLVDKTNFALNGTIDKIFEDAILFTTKQTSSLILLDDIKRIVLLNIEGCSNDRTKVE